MADAVQPASTERRLGSRREAPNSLFGEILDWMLAPLLFLWPISIAATNHVAHTIADQPYDQALADNVAAISRLIRIDGGRISVNLPQAAGTVLRADETDTTYYQVLSPGGKLLHGDKEVPEAEAPEPADIGPVLFRDSRVVGEQVRIAYRYIPVPGSQKPILVQVAETRHKRDELGSRIISGVLLPQFAVIPLAVILVYIGLSRGIAPLARLQSHIRRRRPADLSPIRLTPVPEEVRPLVIAFNEMMGRLEANLQAQQRFIAQAAHQMRTPLTGLKLQTELALSETDPDQTRISLQQIAESAERASHLINQLLMLAQAEASHEKIHKVEPLDLGALARAATQEAVMRALARRIDIGFEGTHWPLMVEGTPLLLRELMGNLIDNAIKYTPEGGLVTVRTRSGEFAFFEVEDNGIGIPEEDRARVFERFYRVLGTDASGSGLGLPIVAEIAELPVPRQLRPPWQRHGAAGSAPRLNPRTHLQSMPSAIAK
jgi:two-component system, OmpR family, sensor histidine kinase TctE